MPTDLEIAIETQKAFAATVLPMYIESAQEYATLTLGALGASMVFNEKLLGRQGAVRPTGLLFGSWIALIAGIAGSAWYQYVAVKLIEHINLATARGISRWDLRHSGVLTIEWLWPGKAYGTMVTGFFVGATLLVLACVDALRNERGSDADNT